MADIDIDFKSDFQCRDIFPEAIPASMINKKNELVKHLCGQYFQNIAMDSVTQLAAIPYEEAEILNYQKFDFLHLSMLDKFNSKHEIRELINQEPDWELLTDIACVVKLLHVHNHHSLLLQTRPHSIIELADTLALIRPDKRHLLSQYLNNKQTIRPLLYRQRNDDKSSFKKGHAIAYSINIVLQLHLITQGRL